MNKIWVITLFIMWFLLFIPPGMNLTVVDATHQSSKPCSINVRSYLYPLTYQGENRSNPDGSVYPGDGFHYLFTFSGSDTCQAFQVLPVKSEGAFDLLSHYVIMGSSGYGPKEKQHHSHDDFNLMLKYLTTTHYYIDRITYPKCDLGTCKTVTEAENPSYSVREDQKIPNQLLKLIENSRTASTYSLRVEETQSWGFTRIGVDHEHGVNKHIYEDQKSADSFEESMINECSKLGKHQGCVFGHVEMDTEIIKTKCLLAELKKMNVKGHGITEDVCVDVADQVSLTVKGKKIQCSDNKCKSILVKRTSNLAANVLLPTLDITLTKPSLPDMDGYDAKNLDGTYYVSDPINVVHEPIFKWKNYREKTIQFKVSKEYELKKESELQCIHNRCDMVLVSPGTSDSDWTFGNGDGLTVYNTVSYDELGEHQFHYTINVYNLDQILNTSKNSIDALVVEYLPKYDTFSYSVLKDDEKSAYEDRMGIAAHYFGSMSEGTNNDVAGLHEDRRSKINYHYYFGIGFDPWDPAILNNTLSWNHASDVGIIHNKSPVTKQSDFNDDGVNMIPSAKENKLLIPFESQTNNTAMFLKSGYGKIFFVYENLTSTLFDLEKRIPKYENATVFTALGSADFAGKKTTYLAFEQYQYPESSFQTTASIISVSSTGEQTPLDITFDVVPQFDIGAVLFSDYVYDKVFYDSGDDGFSQIINDDLYPMNTHESTSDGQITTKIRRISSLFEQYQNNNSTDFTNLSIEDISEKYLKESQQARLNIPLHVGMYALSPITLEMTANGITNSIDGKYIDFEESYDYIINVASDNVLNVERERGWGTIRYNENFGDIVSLEINGTKRMISCVSDCTIPIDTLEALEIKAYNMWGGIATADLEELPEIIPPKQSPPEKFDILYILFVIPIGYIVYRKIRSYR